MAAAGSKLPGTPGSAAGAVRLVCNPPRSAPFPASAWAKLDPSVVPVTLSAFGDIPRTLNPGHSRAEGKRGSRGVPRMTGGANWWRGAVIYQIYPLSFRDSGDDGLGDLPGITSRLPYIASLGEDRSEEHTPEL